MTTKKLTKLLALYLPYLLLGLVATNLGEAWRLAEGKELGERIMSMMGTIPMAFANPLPSLHPLDLLVGLCCGAGLRLAVYLRGKNAKKYRHGMEYGSARWGTAKDIEPFMAPKFADNIWKAHCFINSLRLGSTFSPPFSLESWWCFPLFAGQYCLLKKTPKIFGFFSKNFLSSKIRLSEKPGQTYRYCKRYSDD